MKSGKFKSPGNPDLIHYYNPAVVKVPGKTLFIPRRRLLPYVEHPHGFNQLVAVDYPKNGTWSPKDERLLDFLDLQPFQHVEDPRAIPYGDGFLLSATTFIRYADNTWSGSHQIMGLFDNDLQCHWSALPQIGSNQPTVMMPVVEQEKNWLWFFNKEGNLMLWYSAWPQWIVCEFDGYPWDDMRVFFARRDFMAGPLQWGYGPIRGGTPPILVDDLYWSFFHSWTYWPEGYEYRYYAGAFAFESKPPYLPKKMTTLPLFAGEPMGFTRRDKRDDVRKEKLVVFPCGAWLDKQNQWHITQGLNDQRCGWVLIHHDEVKDKSRDVCL